MMRGAEEIIAAARGCVGARFRPHGRSIALGLDCVGVAGVAFGRTIPADYALRGGRAEALMMRIAAAGLARIGDEEAVGGDLLLLGGGPGQFHLAVLTERGFVHADVGLRRVVETPGRPALPVLGAWREEG